MRPRDGVGIARLRRRSRLRQNADDRAPAPGRRLRVRRRDRKAEVRRVRQTIERVARQTIAICDAKAGAS